MGSNKTRDIQAQCAVHLLKHHSSRCGGIPEQRRSGREPQGLQGATLQRMSDQLQLQRQERQLQRKHHTQLPAEERLRQQSNALHQLHI